MDPGADVAAWPKLARSGSGRFIRVALASAAAALLLGTYLAGFVDRRGFKSLSRQSDSHYESYL
jgi:hypothetical protein